MGDVIFPNTLKSESSSYVINVDRVVEVKFVAQHNTESQKIWNLLGKYLKSSTNEMRKARELNRVNFEILR